MTLLNFPPTNGQPTDGSFTYTANGVIYSWDGEKWTANSEQGLDGAYVNIDGDTMTGDLTVPNLISEGDVQTTSLNGGPLAGMRNQLINSGVTVRQRLPGGGSGFVCDRWFVDHSANTSNAGPAAAGINRDIFATGVTNARLSQAIELENVGKQCQFAPGTQWTVSVWARGGAPDANFVFRRGLQDANNEVQLFTPSWAAMTATGETDGDWTRYALTFTMPDVQASLAAHHICLVASFRFPSDYRATGMQLEPGPVATPFEMRPIGTELALCQRYYYQVSNTIMFYTYGPIEDEKRRASFIPSTPMRVKPTVQTLGGETNTGGGVMYGGTENFFDFRVTGANTSLETFVNGFTADAEL